MPSSRGGVSRPRRTTPQSPQKPQSVPGVTQPTRRSTRSASRDPEPQGKQHLGSALDAVVEEQDPDRLDLQDPSFGYSQVTDFSLQTQSELQSLDPDLIVEALPGLYDDSVRVLSLFSGLNEADLSAVSDDAHDSSTSISKRIHFNVNRLLASLHAFGTVRVFVNPELIIRKLRGDHNVNDESRWRPDAVLYLANTALFLATVIRGNDDQLDQLFQRSYLLFPILFVAPQATSRFATANIRETIELGNLLRTHLFIRHTRQRMDEPGFDPDDALKDIFYNGAEIRGVECTGQEAPFYTKLVEDHLRHLRTFFDRDINASVRLADLEASFSWSAFMHQALSWATARREELEDSVAGQGGVDDITTHLLEPDLVSAYAQANEEPTQSSVVSVRPSGRSLQGNLARKKQLDAIRAREVDDVSFVSQAPSIQGEIAESVVQDNVGTFDMGDEELASVLAKELEGEPDRPQLMIQQGLAHMAQKASQMTAAPHPPPPARFLDRQEGAQRLNFDDATQPEPSRKRVPVAESDDGEFQTDSRPQAKRRRMEDHNIDPALRGDELPEWEMEDISSPQPTLPPPPPPRNRIGRNRATGLTAAQPSSSAPAAVARSPEPSDLNPSTAPSATAPFADSEKLSGASLLRRAQETAKAKGRLHKTHALSQALSGSPDPTQNTIPASQSVSYQERKAWTPAEEQRLIDLIAVHGPAYSKILKDDKDNAVPQLQERSQVQLKDKARNIKFAFLKSGEKLLAGFGAVSIGKKMVEKLQQLNVPIEGDGRDKSN